MMPGNEEITLENETDDLLNISYSQSRIALSRK